MTAATPDEIVEQLVDDAKTFERNSLFLDATIWLVGVAAISALIATRYLVLQEPWATFESWLPWILVFAGGGLAMARKQVEETARAAKSIDDMRVLGPMIQLLDSPTPEVRVFASRAVMNLLPNCEPDDFLKLSSERQHQLLESIFKNPNPLYVSAVITAARRFATPQCIAPLEEFAAGKSAMKRDVGHRARTQAHMALAGIRMQLARQRIEACAESDAVVTREST